MSILDIFQKKQKEESPVKSKSKREIKKPSSVFVSGKTPAAKKASEVEGAKKVEEKKTVVSKSASSLSSRSAIKEKNLLIKPYFSEKFSLLGEKNNKYIFEVHPRATKNEVKKLLENIYNVEVLKINVFGASQKNKRWKNKKSILKGNKKMLVTLREGQKIELGI